MFSGMKIKRQPGAAGRLARLAHDIETPARVGAGLRTDLAEAAHQAAMSIGLGDEQFDIDDLGRMDDRPRQAVAQSPGRIDRREAANVGQRAVGDVMLEGGDRVGTGTALVLNRFRLTSNIGRLTINLEAHFIQLRKLFELSTKRVGRREALGLVQCRLDANPDLDLARCRPKI
jgi:hypothetical protein